MASAPACVPGSRMGAGQLDSMRPASASSAEAESSQPEGGARRSRGRAREIIGGAARRSR